MNKKHVAISGIVCAGLAMGQFVIMPSASADTAESVGITHIIVNGRPFSTEDHRVAVDPFSHQETSWMPIWYLESALKAMGLKNSWNGQVWSIQTPVDWSVEGREVPSARTPTAAEMAISIDGKVVELAPKMVAKDPWGHAETTYVPLYYVMESLVRIGIRTTWNGVDMELSRGERSTGESTASDETSSHFTGTLVRITGANISSVVPDGYRDPRTGLTYLSKYFHDVEDFTGTIGGKPFALGFYDDRPNGIAIGLSYNHHPVYFGWGPTPIFDVLKFVGESVIVGTPSAGAYEALNLQNGDVVTQTSQVMSLYGVHNLQTPQYILGLPGDRYPVQIPY
ncbi:hypothetical protein [Alicyclobacillus mali (ex Roth et al. 2021)]|uniref:hypothetical protein n=1 Tax=Alicyclobacillus mali (ex Roth et al. 2021) TaxID=1123961 RepID=UPI001E2EFB22|nr:hypothetical protein [Alicyclobacillus mali (ex Roth et al. 2021)]